MRIKIFTLIAVTLFSQLSLAAPKIQHWTTSNGARVYFVPAPELPIVDVQIVFDAGGARDGDKPGLALLTNGLMPEGAGKYDAHKISQTFDSLGVQFGNSSHRDMSVLSIRTLSDPEVMKPALEMLTTILTQPTFPKAAFERERKRLLVSIEQRKQSPSALAGEAFYKAVYNSHPYAQLPGGQKDTVNAITLDNISAFYDKYYIANNAVIAIVGDLDRAKAENVVNSLVGRLPEGTAVNDLPNVPALTDAKTISIKHPSAQTHILVGAPGVKRGDTDYFALYVGNHILGGSGLVSRLSDEIREKRGLSYSTYSYFNPMRKNGPYTLGLQTRNESAEEALKVMRDELQKFIDKGPTEKELTAAQKNITGGFPLRISSNKKIISYIGVIGFYGLPLDYLDTFNEKIQSITVKDIKDAYQRRVQHDKMITVLVGGNGTKDHEKN